MCGFLLLGKEFIILWIGVKYIESFDVAALIMIVYLIPLTQGYTHSILQAKNLHRVKSILFLIFTIAGVTSGKFLSDNYGIIGMIIGIASAFFLLHIVLNFYYHIKLGLNIPLFFKKVIIPFIIPFVIIFISNFYFISSYKSNWPLFVLKGIIYTIIYVVVIYTMVLSNDEKEFFKKTLKIKR